MLRPLGLCLLVGALSACSTDNSSSKQADAASPTSVTAVDWQLVQVGSLHADPAAESASWMRVEIKDGQTSVQGNTGCNSMRGNATLSGNQLSFGPIAISKRFCPQVAGIETALLGALQEARSWSIKGGQLELLDEGGAALMLFVAKPTEASNAP